MSFTDLLKSIGKTAVAGAARYVQDNSDWGPRLSDLLKTAATSTGILSSQRETIVAAEKTAQAVSRIIQTKNDPTKEPKTPLFPSVSTAVDLTEWVQRISPHLRTAANFLRKEMGKPHVVMRRANEMTGDGMFTTLDRETQVFDEASMDAAAAANSEVESAIVTFGENVALLKEDIEDYSSALNTQVQETHGFHGDKTAIATQALEVATLKVGKALTDLQVFRQIKIETDTYMGDTRWAYPSVERISSVVEHDNPLPNEFTLVAQTRILQAIQPDLLPGNFDVEWGLYSTDHAAFDVPTVIAGSAPVGIWRATSAFLTDYSSWQFFLRLVIHIRDTGTLPATAKIVIWGMERDGSVETEITERRIVDLAQAPVASFQAPIWTVYLPIRLLSTYDLTKGLSVRMSANFTTGAATTIRVEGYIDKGFPIPGMDPSQVPVTFRRKTSPLLKEVVPSGATFVDYMGELAAQNFDDDPHASVTALWMRMATPVALIINTAISLVKKEDTGGVTIAKYEDLIPGFTFDSLLPVENWIFSCPTNPFTGATKVVKCKLLKLIFGDLETFRVALGADENLARRLLTVLTLPIQPDAQPYASYA
jgi:hypothetical protein